YMYSLSECDYILGPPSTFTAWASFYGQKPLYKILEPEAAVSLDDFYVRESVGHHLD
ncbi:MAG: hypothetical protein JWQ02_166, partial [Capsulimonas sp.]|nr:hypothetical protein [Capsulimonas sp.]